MSDGTQQGDIKHGRHEYRCTLIFAIYEYSDLQYLLPTLLIPRMLVNLVRYIIMSQYLFHAVRSLLKIHR